MCPVADDFDLPPALLPTDAEGYRRAWATIESAWTATVERARRFDETDLHRGVDGEWSFIQTLRHLSYATAAWIERMVLGDPMPWHPLDLPWDEAPPMLGVTHDRGVRPSLDEVLALRARRQATVRRVLADVTEETITSTVTCDEPGWPRFTDASWRSCVLTVFNEEWCHRRFAERDLDRL